MIWKFTELFGGDCNQDGRMNAFADYLPFIHRGFVINNGDNDIRLGQVSLNQFEVYAFAIVADFENTLQQTDFVLKQAERSHQTIFLFRHN